MKLYQRRDVNETLSSTLEIVLKQVRVLIAQSNILQREYRKRDLAIPFSFWSVFILTVKNMQSGSRVTQTGAKLLQSGKRLTTKVRNNLGLSLCAVPQSSVMCVVAYFRRTELLPGVQERNSI